MAYPVSVTLQPAALGRERWTTALRPLLAIPHAILIGPLFWSGRFVAVGLLGAAAYVMAIVSWFTLLAWGEQLPGIRDFSLFYLRWRVKALSYMALLVDRYPPFGEGEYPAAVSVEAPEGPRSRETIALRPLLAIPHLIVLCLLFMAWFVTTVIAWFAIVFTGRCPLTLLDFGAGMIRWVLRVEAYLLLLVDEYPPFAFEDRPAAAPAIPGTPLHDGTVLR